MSSKFNIAIGLNKNSIYLEESSQGRVQSRQVISESFKRSVVLFASEEYEFEVDGMKFKVTCERVE